ncbi:RNA polymerase sigma factor [Actinosynnema pretiosum subsp. pretiosum]|uniref:RNA polymerase sigma factor n=1 Tax=Actinosynnema pretiosum subsp. pretiosum TaxID=103721 RepID=A0AA45L9N8_9PSEU|nr:RNA polymerase ECF-subfamily sigma factor [Actinosynnema pretiosum subsp. pretiosum]QUF06224.1 RNA polymerase sigma factor [Actinosynnema pretiosum subsp. pretiosum]
MDDDELLVIRCKLGEREACAELVRAWHPVVERYVARMLGRGDDDAVQEVWIGVFTGLPRLRDTGRFRAWLYTIARRAVVNRLRGVYREARVELLGGSGGSGGPGGSGWSGGSGGSGERPVDPVADLVLDREAVAAGLADLPPLEREVIVLFHLEDLALETCAQVCGVPVGTVKSRLNRARGLLRAALERKGYPA